MKAIMGPGSDRGLHDILVCASRIVLGGFFLYLGLSKALDPVGFLKLLREYGVVETPWLQNLIAVALPWLEAFCGALLLLGIGVRGTSLVLLVLLVGFTTIVLHRALGIYASEAIAFTAIKFDCGCGAGEVLAWQKLVENLLLCGLTSLTVFSPSTRCCLRHSVFRSTLS